MSGYASDATETFCVTVSTLGGDLFEVACTKDMVGKELWRQVAAEYVPPGSQKMPRVFIGHRAMENDANLVKQGLKDGDALNIVLEEITEGMRRDVVKKVKNQYELTLEDMHVWDSIHALSDKLALRAFEQNLSLPHALRSLTFDILNQSMENVALPAGLQSLTFGARFNHSIEKVILPESCAFHYQ